MEALTTQRDSNSTPTGGSSPNPTGSNGRARKLKRLCSEIMTETWQRIRSRGTVPEHPLGLFNLDEQLWGLHRDEITIIAGRPGEGKTSFALQAALRLAKKVPVLYYTMEMTKTQLCERIISHLEGISNQELRQGISLERYDGRIKLLAERLKDYNFYLIDDRGKTVDEIHDDVAELKPGFFLIDYVQLMRVRNFLKRHESVAADMVHIREIVKKYNCGAILVSQINREGLLKSSGSLEEEASVVIELEWLGQYSAVNNKEYQVAITKQRSGPVGISKLSYFPHTYSFKDPVY